MVVAILTVSRCSEYIIVIIISSQSHGDLSSADNLCKRFGPRSGSTDIGPDLDPTCLCRTQFLKKLILKKKSAT